MVLCPLFKLFFSFFLFFFFLSSFSFSLYSFLFFPPGWMPYWSGSLLFFQPIACLFLDFFSFALLNFPFWFLSIVEQRGLEDLVSYGRCVVAVTWRRSGAVGAASDQSWWFVTENAVKRVLDCLFCLRICGGIVAWWGCACRVCLAWCWVVLKDPDRIYHLNWVCGGFQFVECRFGVGDPVACGFEIESRAHNIGRQAN